MSVVRRVLMSIFIGSIFLLSPLISDISAQTLWPECNIRKKTFNKEACRRKAEQFKNTLGPQGQLDESWYTWAKSAPYPLSEVVSCALASNSLDCLKTLSQQLACTPDSQILFSKAGDIKVGHSVVYNGKVSVAEGEWEVEKEDGTMVVEQEDSRSTELVVDFPNEILLQSVLIFEEESKDADVLKVNGVPITPNNSDRWHAPIVLNKSTKRIEIQKTGGEVEFNICVRQTATSPSPTRVPSVSVSPVPTGGGDGVRFLFNPDVIQTTVGDTVEVSIITETKTEKVFAAEAHVKYDDSLLSLGSVREGTFFPAVLSTNSAGGSSIRGIVAEPADYRTGTGNLATMTFTALKNGQTTITFYCDPIAYNSSKIIRNDINASNIIDCAGNNTLTVQIGDAQQMTPTEPSQQPTKKPTKKPSDNNRVKVIAAILLAILTLLIVILGL